MVISLLHKTSMTTITFGGERKKNVQIKPYIVKGMTITYPFSRHAMKTDMYQPTHNHQHQGETDRWKTGPTNKRRITEHTVSQNSSHHWRPFNLNARIQRADDMSNIQGDWRTMTCPKDSFRYVGCITVLSYRDVLYSTWFLASTAHVRKRLVLGTVKAASSS